MCDMQEANAKANRESDGVIVPKKSSNNKGATPLAEMMEERTPTKRNTLEETIPQSQNCNQRISLGLEGVRQRARKDKSFKFTNLKHHLTKSLLRKSFYELKRNASPGLDGQSWSDYAENLEERLNDLHQKMVKCSYRATPVLRLNIPKEDGTTRPLGITSIEDKVVQQAVVSVLNSIYEPLMYGFSYGFRTGKGQHDALDALCVAIKRKPINWVLDADIKSFFDSIEHEKLMALIELRVGDNWIIRLIRKWLKTGYSEDGEIHRTNCGIPQGAVISPLLANVYLHYVLDQMVVKMREKYPEGEVVIVRYADDFIMGFERKQIAKTYLKRLNKRFERCGLALHPRKTRLIEFGRYANSNRKKRGEGKAETFDFLGFTHISITNKAGLYTIRRKTVRKRFTGKVRKVLKALRKRMHKTIRENLEWLSKILIGFQNYYGVPYNAGSLISFRYYLSKGFLKILRRRSQKGTQLTIAKYYRKYDPLLPDLHVCHPFPEERFDAKYSR